MTQKTLSSKGVVDLILVMDASGSMSSCFAEVAKHMSALVKGFQSNGQTQWDIRVDMVAHDCSSDSCFRMMSYAHDDLWSALYGQRSLGSVFRSVGLQKSQNTLFTRDLTAFGKRLESISTGTDEAPLVALDFALDFPWREPNACHRVIIQLGDEPLSGGCDHSRFSHALIEKIEARRIIYSLIAPECDEFYDLSQASRALYFPVSGDAAGLTSIDFGDIMFRLGQSVSALSYQGTYAGKTGDMRGLFDQKNWSSDGKRCCIK